LEESLGLDFDDYPLEYEILEEGDHYHDPSIPESSPTWLYTVVEPGFSFPEVQYEILAQLVLPPYRSLLTAEAFSIVGEEYDDEVWEIPNSGGECEEGCPSYPCCLLFVSVGCFGECTPPGCTPLDPNWPECLGVGPPQPGTTTNACGCQIPAEPRFPAGCVRVTDTQLGNEGVKHLKVVVKDGFFKRKETETDDNGCFFVDEIHGGRVKVKIKFENEKAKFRAIRDWGLSSIVEYANIMKHKIILQDPPYNNIGMLYAASGSSGSHDRARWYAATGNNAIHEFYEFATNDGIATPPGGLDVLLTIADAGEAAPMFDEMSANPIIFTGGALGIAGLLNIIGLFNPATPPNPAMNALFSTYLTIWAPDIVYNHGGEGMISDQVKDSWYHEFAHASHFNALNDNGYWLDNAWHIAWNNGYGNGTENGAGRCEIIEMWGYHIGPVDADRQYGLAHSNTTNPNPAVIERRRHIFLLEEFTPNPSSTNPHLWIPKGVLLDCIDDNSLNPASVTDGVVSDNFSGYSLSQCFQSILNSPPNVQTVRNRLRSNFLPPGVSGSSVDALFLEYGF
jgi:hypothetical protein